MAVDVVDTELELLVVGCVVVPGDVVMPDVVTTELVTVVVDVCWPGFKFERPKKSSVFVACSGTVWPTP